ncbi:type II toxin-antitoxin system RelE family toxin [Aphanothece sacrum]|uniref:type II toxin-antitoxin system RelE family toxin n=1 Tax=Aphanothece sacrum TaxID=1122 RepID=UPI001D132523|nr:type II toxin-antitoxin system RelE/ParE family toxin [Aphanothece sacrum]
MQHFKIVAKIEVIADNLQGDVKKSTNFSQKYRLRVGNYQVLFYIEDDTLIIYRVKHRQNAYN